jgi:NAD(P)-dependent dehydrogenase (short-subunit alcohol dehydrogenase family)
MSEPIAGGVSGGLESGSVRFDGRVAIVTGAGNGLGRAHALLLAERGARVVVNDLGDPDVVVQEIRARGGEAVANGDSVIEGERIVENALDEFGGIHIVVNNAGILRDRSFHKMELEEWKSVLDVHLEGAQRTTHAAWPHLRSQTYGRILFTLSAAGLYGNFGQANYGAAKLGLYGLMRALSVEGEAKNIHSNAIAPIAASQMMGARMPDEWLERLDPSHVSPLVAWLCHQECEENGGLFEAGGGWYAKVRWQRSAGACFAREGVTDVDDVAARWEEAVDFTEHSSPGSVAESTTGMLSALQQPTRKAGSRLGGD